MWHLYGYDMDSHADPNPFIQNPINVASLWLRHEPSAILAQSEVYLRLHKFTYPLWREVILYFHQHHVFIYGPHKREKTMVSKSSKVSLWLWHYILSNQEVYSRLYEYIYRAHTSSTTFSYKPELVLLLVIWRLLCNWLYQNLRLVSILTFRTSLKLSNLSIITGHMLHC